MTAPYAERAITLTFSIGSGPYGDGPPTMVTVAGLRVQCEISSTGLPGTGTLHAMVYGLPLSQMNQLSTLGLYHQARMNTVTVMAGDSVSGMSRAFVGDIIDCYSDFGSPPEMAMSIMAVATYMIAMKPVRPSSFPGTADVATIMGVFAKAAGLTLENGGVTVKLSNPYFPGTLWDQIKRCATAANINCVVDREASVLAIWPRGGTRPSDAVAVSAQTGMIGYPAYQRASTFVRTLYSPTARVGGTIDITSEITPANGLWQVIQVDHALSSQMPDGPWETNLTAIRYGTTAPGRAQPATGGASEA